MGDLSKNFSAWEFWCPCDECSKLQPSNSIIILLEDGRSHFVQKTGLKVRVKINSGIRCPMHNEEIGGSDASRHMRGDAADVVFEMMEWETNEWIPIDPEEVNAYYDARYPDMLGLGIYNNRNHIDGRLTRARWDERTK